MGSESMTPSMCVTPDKRMERERERYTDFWNILVVVVCKLKSSSTFRVLLTMICSFTFANRLATRQVKQPRRTTTTNTTNTNTKTKMLSSDIYIRGRVGPGRRVRVPGVGHAVVRERRVGFNLDEKYDWKSIKGFLFA